MSCIYDVQCIAFLPYSETNFYDSILPKHFAASQSYEQDLVVTSNTQLVFVSENGTATSNEITLEGRVDALCWSPEGKYVAAVDSLGYLHIIPKLSTKVLYSNKILPDDHVSDINDEEKICFSAVHFSKSKSSGLYNLAIAGVNGKVYIFDNIDLQSISEALAKNDMAAKTLKKEIKTYIWDVSSCHERVNSLMSYGGSFQASYIIVGSGRNFLSLWEKTEDIVCDRMCADFSRKYSLDCDTIINLPDNCSCCSFVKVYQAFSALFCLDNQGHLYQFGLPCLLLVRYWPMLSIIDFVIKMPCSPYKHGMDLAKIYAIVQNPKSGLSLSVFNLLTMEKIFETSVKKKSSFIMPPKMMFEDLFFLEEGRSVDSNKELGLRLNSISEASPDSRLLILLQQHSYKEAADFATKFNLDLQPVYQQEASFILNSMSHMSESNEMEVKFKEFKACVSGITDAVFIGELCTSVTLSDLTYTFQLLTLAHEYLDSGGRFFRASVSQVDNNVTDMQLRLEVDRLLDLLVTFRMAFENSSATSWQRFRSSSLPGEVARLLSAGRLQPATVICSRHENELIAYLEGDDGKRFHSLLKIISDDSDTDDLINWLELIIPALLSSTIPQAVEVLLSWLHNRAEALEEIFPEKWPENGLKLANVFFSVQKNLSSIGFVREEFSSTYFILKKDEVAKLRLLVSRLQLLSKLQARYQCKVSLDEFIKETTVTLTFRMLDKVTAPQLVKQCLETTLWPYMKEHQLNEEETLLLYIKDVLSQNNKYSRGLFHSICERKIIAIIKCMQKPRTIVESTAVLAKKASIPWSVDMNALVQNAFKLSDDILNEQDQDSKDKLVALRNELLNCVHLEKVPAIAAKYDIHQTPQHELAHERFVRFLIKHDTDEALKDAVEIARTFTDVPEERVYLYRIAFLIEQNKVNECVDILDKKPEISINLMKHVIIRTTILLEQTHMMAASLRISYCLATVNMIEHMLHRSIPIALRKEWIEDLDMIKSIHMLQSRYNELVTVADFHDPRFRDSLLSKNIVLHYQSKPVATTTTTAFIQSNVTDLSELSQISSNNTSVASQIKQSYEKDGSGDAEALPSTVPPHYTSFASVLNLARLLKIPHQLMQSQIALKAAKQCQAEAAISICKELYYTSPTTDTAETLQKIALVLLKFLETHPDLINKLLPEIHEIACAASTCCHKDKLLDVILLLKLARLSRNVQNATDASTQAFLSKCMASGPKAHRSCYDHIEWIHSWYEEADGLTLQSKDVFQLLAKLQTCLFNDKGVSLLSTQPTLLGQGIVTQLGQIVMEMANLLANSRHHSMALEWISEMLSITVTHLSNHKAFYGDNKGIKAVVELIMQAMCSAKKKMKSCVEVLVEKVMATRNPDVAYGIGLMLDLQPDQAFNLLNNISQSFGNNFNRISAVACAGLQVSQIFGVVAEVPRYEQLILSAKWGQKLCKLQIPADGILNSSPQWKQRFLVNLLTHPRITAAVLLNYCKDYNLDCDQTLLQYVTVLLGGEVTLQYQTKIGSAEKGMVEFARDTSSALVAFSSTQSCVSSKENPNTASEDGRPWDKIREELQWISRNIENKYEMLRQLERSLRNIICPYNYDRAEFLLNLIQKCMSATEGVIDVGRGLKLIGYLRYVKRDSKPTDYEMRRMWRHDGKESFSQRKMPDAARERLPLHPFLYGDASQAWKILSDELSEKSADLFAPIAKLLQLNIDKLYMTAAENIIVKATKNADGKSQLTNQHISNIQGLIEKVNSIKMAVAMAKRVCEILPIGQEKVDAYKWCISLVTRWRTTVLESSPEYDVISTAYQTLVWNYKCVDTQRMLVQEGLDGPENLKLMSKPTDLILHLYQHHSIVQRFYEPGDKYPDIHAVVASIAELNELDVSDLRLAVIFKLLVSTKQQTQIEDDDSTTNIERLRSAALANPSKQCDEKELIQLLYLLPCSNPLKQAKYLMNIIRDRKNQGITNVCRVRALRCLFYLISDEHLPNLTGKSADELKADLRILIYLTELESANFKIPASQLKQSDKSSVARSVIAFSARKHNPAGLRAAAEMCREFGSVQRDTWVALLQQLVALQQVAYLQKLLPDICRIPSVRSLLCLASVWQSCVTLPLVALTPPLDANQREVALSSYRFLLRCPVLLRIDLAAVAEQFSAVEMHVLALGCLLVSPSKISNAKKLAKSMIHEIRNEIAEIHTQDQPLLGHVMINQLLQEISSSS
ncbi:unnamed protein product [Clavelina lepadiformis]|uniref:Kinetochore-associated protein 1 n=1 Tax=Clavelina lepadiformis TaxID=159417 RepID=A0ABP0FB49_CLALP